MNILPIIFAFILIFSFINSGLLHERTVTRITEKSVYDFHRINIEVQNAIAYKQYRRAITATASTQAPTSRTATSSSLKKYFNKRDTFPSLEESKLNLLALFELKTDPKMHPLYEVCAQLIRILYAPLLHETKRESVEYELLDAMIAAANEQEIKTLSDLYPASCDLKPIFYKMLQGTNDYNLQSRTGIPPLLDFFCLNKSAAIHYAFASCPLLEAMFGKKIALRICAEEKKKWITTHTRALTQEELFLLLASDPACSSIVSQLGAHVNFSQKIPKRTSLARKGSNGLTVRKVF